MSLDRELAIAEFRRRLPADYTERDRDTLCYWLDRPDSTIGMVFHAAVLAGYTLGYTAGTFDQLGKSDDATS